MIKCFTVCLLILLSFQVSANELNICLTGTTVKTIPGYGDAFYNGALLAKKESYPINKKIKVNILKYFYDRTPLAPLKKAKEMVKGNCHAIIGFSTGNDLLAVKDYINNVGIFSLSIYGDRSPKLETVPHLLTFQPTQEYFVDKLFLSLSKKVVSKNNYLVVTAVDRTAMNGYQQEFVSHLKKLKKNILLSSVIEKTGDLDNFVQVYKANKHKVDGVILLTRSVLAAKITDYIYKDRKGKQLPLILGTGYFGSSALPAYLNWVENKNIEAYFVRMNCMKDTDIQFQKFLHNYTLEFPLSRFKHGPMIISSYTYDAVKMIINSIQGKNINDITIQNVRKAIEQSSYEGITGVKLDKMFRISNKKSFLIKVTKNGYECIN